MIEIWDATGNADPFYHVLMGCTTRDNLNLAQNVWERLDANGEASVAHEDGTVIRYVLMD